MVFTKLFRKYSFGRGVSHFTLFLFISLFIFVSCSNDHSKHHHQHHETSVHDHHKHSMIEGVDINTTSANALAIMMQYEKIGEVLPEKVKSELNKLRSRNDSLIVHDIQSLLDPLCLVNIHINPESRVKVKRGKAPTVVYEQAWSTFLVKIHSEAGVTAPLNVKPFNFFSSEKDKKKPLFQAKVIDANGTKISSFDLLGTTLSYAILMVYCRDKGKREVTLSFDAGQGTQDIGFRSEVPILFESIPTYEILIREGKGKKIMVNNRDGKIFPSIMKRSTYDFWVDAEKAVRVPSGDYELYYWQEDEKLVEDFSIRKTAVVLTL